MKKSHLTFCSAIAAIALTSCGPVHEHTFSEEWSSDAAAHWHDATCEHTELSSNRTAHTDTNEDGLCDVCNYEIGHNHTYKSEWTTNQTHHWHDATCSHTSEKENYGAHTFDNSGVCTTCGYIAPNLYPVITKYTQGPSVFENTWADDCSNVITDYGSQVDYLGFNEDGYVISEGKMDGDTPVIDKTYTFDDGLKTSYTHFEQGEVSFKETYTYTDDKKPLCKKYYDYSKGAEKLWKQEDFEYFDGYWTETTTMYDDDAKDMLFSGMDKWTITTEGENTKHTFERQHEENGPFKFIGYLVYNKLGQLIETKDICYSNQGDYFKYEYVTYTEDGDLSTLIEKFDGSDGNKTVYSYDENGFIVDMKSYDYNSSTSDYDILTGGYDYTVDSRGTVVKMSQYIVDQEHKVVSLETEIEIKYIPVKLEIDYLYYNAETKGSYNHFIFELLPILG